MSTKPIKAFTLTELVMAMAITSLIGMSVATVAAVLSHAQSHTDSMTESIQSGRVAMMSIDADVRKARLVTATADGEIALWTGDDNADGQINVDELVLIQSISDDGTVERWQVIFPDSMPPDLYAALNVSKPLKKVTKTSAVRKLLNRAAYSAYLSRRVLAADVSNFEVVTNVAPPLSTLVLMRLAVGQETQQITLTNTAGLRADATDCVVYIKGKPVLQLDGGDDDDDD